MVVAREAYVGCNKRISRKIGPRAVIAAESTSCVAAAWLVLYKLTVLVMRAAGRRLVNSGTDSDKPWKSSSLP